MKASPTQILAEILTEINKLHFDREIRILNVCGGHERSISNAGLRTLLPKQIHLIPGPGCPVCVCPSEIINYAISLAQHKNIILACFGDMINVPANNKKSEIQSLNEARQLGHEIAAVSSPAEVIRLAEKNIDKTIVFFIAGFETSMAPIVAMLDQLTHTRQPANIRFLLSAKKTWPIVASMLDDPEHMLDGIIAPGHVATVMGSNEWHFIPEQHNIACAVSGFTTLSVLESIKSILNQIKNKKPVLDNCYKETVTNQGNLVAQNLMKKYLLTSDEAWRGIGIIKSSGFSLKKKYANYNAEMIIPANSSEDRKNETPAGCDCPKIIMGKRSPVDCKLFGKPCSPSKPVGPCMVSAEGACNIWWHTNSTQLTQSYSNNRLNT
ncbi:MAG: hydrogenase formation protein HypD [Gammaproteobacteria bacterium]|nr:hydrogenase formation protein HypD [Gammaproteobacteria bacterium]